MRLFRAQVESAVSRWHNKDGQRTNRNGNVCFEDLMALQTPVEMGCDPYSSQRPLLGQNLGRIEHPASGQCQQKTFYQAVASQLRHHLWGPGHNNISFNTLARPPARPVQTSGQARLPCCGGPVKCLLCCVRGFRMEQVAASMAGCSIHAGENIQV